MNSNFPPVLHLAVACDARYLAGAIGTLGSIRLAVPLETEIEVIFLYDGFTQEDQDRLHAAMARLKGAPKIEFVKVDDSFATFPDFYFGSKMAYARLILPGKVSLENLIYIDVDMLVLKNLCELLEYELPEKGIGGCLEEIKPCLRDDMPEVLPVPLDPAATNLNSGLLALDMTKLKRAKTFDQALEILRDFPNSCRWHDQSAINYTLNNNAEIFDQSWNKQTHRAVFDPIATIPQLSDRSLNVHFVGKAKPWLSRSQYPADRMFRMLLDALDPEWKKQPVVKSIRWKSKEPFICIVPMYFRLRAFLMKLRGGDPFFDTRNVGIWSQFKRDVAQLRGKSAELRKLYRGWQEQIQAGLVEK